MMKCIYISFCLPRSHAFLLYDFTSPGQQSSLIWRHTTSTMKDRIFSSGTEKCVFPAFFLNVFEFTCFTVHPSQQRLPFLAAVFAPTARCSLLSYLLFSASQPRICRHCVLIVTIVLWQEEGELIFEGLLNIFWGLRRPIRLQMQDDHERIRPPPSSTSWHSGCNLDSQG